MRCKYINIIEWIMQIALICLMFVALFGDAFGIAIGAMFAIYYVEFIREYICERRINVKRIVSGQH